jgi:COP9 signalosome complex subunit 2
MSDDGDDYEFEYSDAEEEPMQVRHGGARRHSCGYNCVERPAACCGGLALRSAPAQKGLGCACAARIHC